MHQSPRCPLLHDPGKQIAIIDLHVLRLLSSETAKKTLMYKALILISALWCFTLSGCVSPVAINSLSRHYNETIASDLAEQLLLNIARASNNQPILFTGISNIAATLNFQANVGATPALTGSSGTTLMPLFGVGAAENPTISIVPMQGEEFTRRMLTPMTEDKLALLLRQNVDVDLLLRLAGLEFRTFENGAEEVYHNRPRNRKDYASYRRMVLHLSSIQDRDHLFFEPIILTKHWRLPVNDLSAKDFSALEKDYDISIDRRSRHFTLQKLQPSRIVISNYSPALLTEVERLKLDQEAQKLSPNDVLIDIRPDYPGGELPIHGRLRLRSFSNILYFIGRTLFAEPEVDVSKDAKTPPVKENPVSVLSIQVTENKPNNSGFVVDYDDHYYSLPHDRANAWNETAFRVLEQIYQMTMSELPKGLLPSITISK